MAIPLRALLVEDSEDDAVLIVRQLQRGGYDVTFERVDTPETFGAALEQRAWDIVIADYSMPRFSGLAALDLFKQSDLDIPFIIVSGTIGEDIAVSAMRSGAHDYLMKDNLTRLGPTIRRELQEAEIRLARRRAEETLRQRTAHLEALQQVSLELTAQLDLDTLLHSIVSRAIELLDGTAGGLFLHRPEQDVLEWSIGIGSNLLPIGTIFQQGAGLSGKVWETGDTFIVDDYHNWEGRSPNLTELANVAAAGALVRWGEESLGVLSVLAETSRKFSESDAELLSSFATQAAIAIRNARLYEAADRRAGRLGVVNHIGKAVGTTLHLDDLLEIVYQEISSIFLADAFFIALYDEAANELDFRMLVDAGLHPPPVKEPVGTGLTSLIVRDKTPLLIQDMEQERETLPEPTLWGTMSLPSSWLGVPMLIDERLVGVISVQAYRSHAYGEEDQLLLSTIADQVAVAVEKARLYQTLHDSEERYRTLVEQANDAVFVETLDGQILDVNERACRLLGYERKELLRMNVVDLLPPEMLPGLAKLVQKQIASGPMHTETDNMHKDGTRIAVEVSTTPLEVGGAKLILALVRDVTERKQAEREVKERQQYLEQVLASAPDAIVTADPQHRIVEWNSGAERLFGYPSDEAIGVVVDQLIARGKVLEEAVRYSSMVADGREVGPVETVRYRKDGTPVNVILAASPIFFDKELVGLVAVYTDITEVRRAERLLQALNEAALAMEQALTPQEIFVTVGEKFKELGFSSTIFLTDDERINLFPKYFSYEAKAVKAAEKLIGVRADELSIPIETVGVFKQTLREGRTVLVAGEGAMGQMLSRPLRRFAGRIIKMLGVGKSINAPLIVEDEIVGLLSVQSDDLTEDDIPAITAFAHQVAAVWHKAQLMEDLEQSLNELQSTQGQLFQAQKMEALGRLAGGIAHDFNNLLTVIDLSTRLLERQMHPDDPLWEHIQRIQETGERASKLTKQLLSFSRREIIEPRVANLNDLLANLSRMLQRIIGEDVSLVTNLAKDLWSVKVDPPQMEQVIVNLVVNARDAMPHGGCLSIETQNVVIDEAYVAQHVDTEPGEHVMLTISDTGVGMDDEVKKHLFEPFFTTKERGQGTGLGLPTAFGIIKQSGGHISVYSEVGQGSMFRIYLPRSTEQETELPAYVESLGIEWGTETILVVEDEAAVRDLAVQTLKTHGYSVLSAGSGVEALQISDLFSHPIHLLLTDVVMPQMNGRELAEELRARRAETKVLYMSGYSSDVIAHHGVLQDGTVILLKPFTLEALTHKIREVLDAAK